MALLVHHCLLNFVGISAIMTVYCFSRSSQFTILYDLMSRMLQDYLFRIRARIRVRCYLGLFRSAVYRWICVQSRWGSLRLNVCHKLIQWGGECYHLRHFWVKVGKCYSVPFGGVESKTFPYYNRNYLQFRRLCPTLQNWMWLYVSRLAANSFRFLDYHYFLSIAAYWGSSAKWSNISRI